MDLQRQNAHGQFQSHSRRVQGVAFPPFVCRLGHEKQSYRRPECGMENEGVTIHAEDTCHSRRTGKQVESFAHSVEQLLDLDAGLAC
jgi:hypothetical protein